MYLDFIGNGHQFCVLQNYIFSFDLFYPQVNLLVVLDNSLVLMLFNEIVSLAFSMLLFCCFFLEGGREVFVVFY